MRQAMSKAINRDAIVERVMEGVAVPAGQFLPDGYFGISEKLKPVAYDAEGAKKLLAEAGYPNGFKLTLHTPNGRYINDVKIAEAVAQMLTRVGIETALEALPPACSSRAPRRAGRTTRPSSASSWSAGARGTGENSGSLMPLVNTFDAAKGTGTANRGRYSNPEVDKLSAEALAHQRRRQARRAAGQGHRDRHRRCGAHPAALPGQHLGRAQGAQVQGALGRVHACHRRHREVSGG